MQSELYKINVFKIFLNYLPIEIYNLKTMYFYEL